MSKGSQTRPEREPGLYGRGYEGIDWDKRKPSYVSIDITTPADSYPAPGTLLDVFTNPEMEG